MNPADYLLFIGFLGLGCLSLGAALLNPEWFFSTSAAQTFVRSMGRKGARWLYALLGVLLLVSGIVGLLCW